MPVGNDEHQRIDEVSTDTLRYSVTRDNWFGIVMHECEPTVLVHHSIVLRWCSGSLVSQRPLSLLLSIMYQLLLSMT